jgi:hypothetical protein
MESNQNKNSKINLNFMAVTSIQSFILDLAVIHLEEAPG